MYKQLEAEMKDLQRLTRLRHEGRNKSREVVRESYQQAYLLIGLAAFLGVYAALTLFRTAL